MTLHRVIPGLICLALVVWLVISSSLGASRPIVILYTNDTSGYLDPCG